MLSILLYTLFFLSAVLLIFIVLIQAGKGGGIADAFGGAGAQTFGVRAGGVNRVTMVIFAVFLLSAFALNKIGVDSTSGSVGENLFDAAPAAAPAPEGATPPANQ
jgi:preprotein translocase subunit SecG